MEQFSFEKLDAYKSAIHLVSITYNIIKKFLFEEKFSLSSQLRRAIVSIPSNIAEGCGRTSYKEKIHYTEIAYGSLLESYCQIQIALTLKYISEDDFNLIKPNFFLTSRLLGGLRHSYQKILNQL